MKSISIAPRKSIHQGLDLENKLVKKHTEKYNELLAQVTESVKGELWLDPYGTAPLSGYLGMWKEEAGTVHISIKDENNYAIPVEYDYIVNQGSNLVPIIGLVPDAINKIKVNDKEEYLLKTAPLPPSDREILNYPKGAQFIGFPEYKVTVPYDKIPSTLKYLYFTAFAARYNVGVDCTGTTRWFTTLDIPNFCTERLSNGHFLSTAPEFDESKLLYEFDMIGRVHRVYVLDNQCHHSVYELPDGNILYPSECTGESREDGLSILDINTGKEIAYYDIRKVLDTKREPIPKTVPVEDWIHINQSYLDTKNNMLVSSGRHQGVFGIDKDTAEVRFILANHEDWAKEFEKYLLTPIDQDGQVLYDLSNPDDIEKADKEFWQWGQHAAMPIPNSEEDVVEFVCLDNGNYRSRHREHALVAEDNWTRAVRYKVNLKNMTVMKVFDYGKEVGSRGYSSYVSNVDFLEDGNYLVNFGGGTFDENGRRRTTIDDFADVKDPLSGQMVQGMVLIQEVDSETKKPKLEFTCTSGRFKGKEEGKKFTVDIYSFRTHKLPLIPWN